MSAKAKIVALLVSVSIATAYAADWPGYMGPKRDGTSAETGLLRSWPKEGQKVLWTVPLGRGFAGPAVSRGNVYLLDRNDAGVLEEEGLTRPARPQRSTASKPVGA